MDGARPYILMTMGCRFILLPAIALAALPPQVAQGQSRVSVEQLTPRAGGAAIRVAPVRGARSSAAVQETPREGGAAPVVPPEVIEECRRAQAEDRRAANGVDCVAVFQAAAAAAPPVTAEGSLLQLFGQSGDVTGPQPTQNIGTVDADAVARQLSTGEVQGGAGSGAAAVIGRDRAPPPSNPPR